MTLPTSFRTIITGLAITALALSSQSAEARDWSGLNGGASDWVYASTVYNGNLVVGGQFTSVGGVAANRIAQWNGVTWQALGPGFDGEVQALAVYNGKLIAGGAFVFSGSLEVKFIAEWDGTSWIDMEGGMDNRVVALTVYNGSLIAGGYFHDANGPANNIARWDGHKWYPLGSGTAGGTQGQVMALAVYGSDLIAGGFISSAGGVGANHVAKWNGTTWAPLGAGVNQIVYSLATNGNSLAVGCLNGCWSWNGSTWTTMLGAGPLGGTYPYVLSLASYGGNIFAGGLFTSIGGISANGIARWNGSEWSQVDSGVFAGGSTAGVYTLSPWGNSLAAGGIFNSAGSVNVGHIGIWNQAFFDHGVGCPGSGGLVPDLAGFGTPAPNLVTGLQVTNGKHSGTGLLFLATAGASVPVMGCTFLLGGTVFSPVTLPLNSLGSITLSTPFPTGVPSGAKLYMQFIGLDPGAANGSFSTSNELMMVVQ